MPHGGAAHARHASTGPEITMRWSKQRMEQGAAASGAVLIAFALDRVGEPPANWHPVVWYGRLIRRLPEACSMLLSKEVRSNRFSPCVCWRMQGARYDWH